MDENKKELMENEAQEAAENTLEETAAQEAQKEVSAAGAEESVQQAAEESAEEAAESAEEAAESTEEAPDSTFSVEKVSSEEALNELLNAEKQEDSGEEVEQELEMELAKYAADCESCATRVFFEIDDLNENGNLICPNCQEEIEINHDAIDYYLVNKEEAKQPTEGNYIADCDACEAVVHFTQDDIDDEENIICPQCGEKIHIETEVLDAYLEDGIKKDIKRKKTNKRILSCVLGVVIALVLSFCFIFFVGNRSVVKVGKTSVPMNIYKCVYYIETASNYSGAGFNIDEKPSKQPYENSDDYDTWDDFLKTQTADILKLYYGIYNAGKEEGYELTEKDKNSIDEAIDSINSAADSAKLLFEDYMKSNYGLKIKEKPFREYLELTVYVNSYYKSVMAKDVSQEELDAIYNENPENYEVVTFRYLYLQISDSLSKEDALKAVESIAKAKDEDEFKALILENVSEDKAEQYKDDSATLVKDMACSNITGRPVAKMLTDANSKQYQTSYGVADDDTYAEVAMLLDPRHKDESLILDTAINQVSAEKGQAYIDDIRENTVIKSSVGMILRNLTF